MNGGAAPKERAMKPSLNWLKRTYQQLRREKLSRWRRCLPFSELVVDRWEKARFLGFGEGASIYDSSYVFGSVKVGAHTWVGPFTILDGSGGLEIGDYCSISSGVQIYSHETIQWAVSGGKAPYEYAPVSIGSRCYIGPNTVVAKGVTIGEGCIIGAGSLVLSDIPPGSKAFGTPCRVVAALPRAGQP